VPEFIALIADPDGPLGKALAVYSHATHVGPRQAWPKRKHFEVKIKKATSTNGKRIASQDLSAGAVEDVEVGLLQGQRGAEFLSDRTSLTLENCTLPASIHGMHLWKSVPYISDQSRGETFHANLSHMLASKNPHDFFVTQAAMVALCGVQAGTRVWNVCLRASVLAAADAGTGAQLFGSHKPHNRFPSFVEKALQLLHKVGW
jgi:hypothetical protein